jgi:hypothetical protein
MKFTKFIEKYKFLPIAFTIVIICALFLSFVKNSFASETNVVINWGTVEGNLGRFAYLQEIKDHIITGPANKFDVAMYSCDTPTFDFELYSGSYNGTCNFASSTCGSNILIVNDNPCSVGTSTVAFPSTVDFNSTTDYFYVINAHTYVNYRYVVVRWTVGSQIDGNLYYNDYGAISSMTNDMRFRIYNDTGYTPSGDITYNDTSTENATSTYVVDPGLYMGECAYSPCVKLRNTPKYCYYDTPAIDCTLDFEYNGWVTAGTLAYAIQPTSGNTSNAVGSILTGSTAGGYDQIIVPNPGVASTSLYGLWLEIPNYGGYRLSTYMVEWVKYGDIGTGTSLYDIPCNCDNVATSTGIFDEFRYGIECGGHMLSCWLFQPSRNTTDKFSDAIFEMEAQFPINAVLQVKDIFVELNATTSATSTFVISGLAGQNNMDDLNGLDILPLSNYNINSTIYPLVNKMREIMVFLIWFVLGLYFIYRIWRITRKPP